jgi:hypothetical protein
MREIAPGIWHWTALHPKIKQEVSSYWIEPAAAIIDPMEPEEGLGWWEGRPRPARVVLTNRHHYRAADRFVEAFGCSVHCSEPGLHEFEGGPDVQGFWFGEEVAPGITALEVDAICPDEAALHIALDQEALALADGAIRPGGDGTLSFVPDFLMGDDPEGVKTGLIDSYRRLLGRSFEHLLLAHGNPVVGEGRAALAAFVESPASLRGFD